MMPPAWFKGIKFRPDVRFMVGPVAASAKIRSSRIPWMPTDGGRGFQILDVIVLADPGVTA